MGLTKQDVKEAGEELLEAGAVSEVKIDGEVIGNEEDPYVKCERCGEKTAVPTPGGQLCEECDYPEPDENLDENIEKEIERAEELGEAEGPSDLPLEG